MAEQNQNNPTLSADNTPPTPPAGQPAALPKPIPVYLSPGPSPGQRPRGTFLARVLKTFLGLVLFCSLMANIYLGMIVFSGLRLQEYRSGNAQEKIALIHLEGAIDMDTAREMHTHFRRAEKDAKVKAVILVVNSPGGQVVPSSLISKYIRDFRQKTKKKVYACIEQVGASGAYWIASAADKIYAQENGAVGSIGVIGTFFVVEQGLKEKLGVTPVIIKSTKSPYKDRGSPFHMPTEQEIAEIRQDIDGIHARFVAAVSKGRGLTEEEVWTLADGDVYYGDQAQQKKLIDKVGFLDDVIDDLARELKLAEPLVIHYLRPATLREIFFAGAKNLDHPLDLQKQLEKWALTPRIQALWLGE